MVMIQKSNNIHHHDPRQHGKFNARLRGCESLPPNKKALSTINMLHKAKS
jgi:hypothetical protein